MGSAGIFRMKLSVIIPCYNEMATIEAILKKVRKAPLEINREIVIVDDASTDGTREYLQHLSGEERDLKIVFHEENKGKGASLRSGFQQADGDILIVQDADLEYDPNDFGKILKPIIEGKADVVFGSRFSGGESHRVLYFWHYLGNKFLTLLSNAFTNLNLTDMEVGYKAFRKEMMDQVALKENRFGFDPEVTAKISRLKCRIYEVGVSYHGRTYDEGKKINWKDGLRALYVVLKYGLFR